MNTLRIKVEYQTEIIDEQALAASAKEGDRNAFDTLVEYFTPRLKSFLVRRMNNRGDVEDVVQETFLKAYVNISSYNEKYRFSCWLFTIASRTAINLSRAKQPQSYEFLEYIESDSQNPLDAACDYETSENLWNEAKKLEPKQYSAVYLRYSQDMTVKEIAKVLNTSMINVRVLLHRGRNELIKKMKKQENKDK